MRKIAVSSLIGIGNCLASTESERPKLLYATNLLQPRLKTSTGAQSFQHGSSPAVRPITTDCSVLSSCNTSNTTVTLSTAAYTPNTLHASRHTHSSTYQCSITTSWDMGVNFTSRPKKEDVTSKETPKISGREGTERCHSIEQVLGLRKCETSASFVSFLRQW